ncbi:DUF503 domain-containing protein [Oligoflexia bacterium]|nr:DUF503 domain-containing protein [Oligoflexia bacterium]
MGANAVHIAVLVVDLHIPGAQSLKAKRRVIKSLKDRIRAKFNVSVAELDALDKWQRSICGITMIGNDQPFLDRCMQQTITLIETIGELQILDTKIEFL